MSPTPDLITGLVLAGGRGRRMGGLDKGLQVHAGHALATHALQRLAPQVSTIAVSANRHLGDYGAMGVPVWPDAMPDYPGPLAGLHTGLIRCLTPWLVTVPCDAPHFPTDLVARLAAGAEAAGADIAMAQTRRPDGNPQLQPVFCLVRASLADDLDQFLRSGERQVALWTQRHRQVTVPFDDVAAFVNINSLDDLRALSR